MTDKPDFSAQFRADPRSTVLTYMGGACASCGDHPSLPKRHRWSKVREFRAGSKVYRDRMCLNCALTKSV